MWATIYLFLAIHPSILTLSYLLQCMVRIIFKKSQLFLFWNGSVITPAQGKCSQTNAFPNVHSLHDTSTVSLVESPMQLADPESYCCLPPLCSAITKQMSQATWVWDLSAEPRRRPSRLQNTGHMSLPELCLLPFPGRAKAVARPPEGCWGALWGVEPCRAKPSGPCTESTFSFSNIGESMEAVQPGGQVTLSWLSHSTASGKCQFSGVTQSRSLCVLGCPVQESVIFHKPLDSPSAQRDFWTLSLRALKEQGLHPSPEHRIKWQVCCVVALEEGTHAGQWGTRWPEQREAHTTPHQVTGDTVPSGTQALCTDRLPAGQKHSQRTGVSSADTGSSPGGTIQPSSLPACSSGHSICSRGHPPLHPSAFSSRGAGLPLPLVTASALPKPWKQDFHFVLGLPREFSWVHGIMNSFGITS